MKLYLNLRNGISEIEASETPQRNFEPHAVLPYGEFLELLIDAHAVLSQARYDHAGRHGIPQDEVSEPNILRFQATLERLTPEPEPPIDKAANLLEAAKFMAFECYSEGHVRADEPDSYESGLKRLSDAIALFEAKV